MGDTKAGFDKPDFIGIGMMKAGTGWLYDQLRSHPGAWVPPKKELQFFNNYFAFPSTMNSLSQVLVEENDLEGPFDLEHPPAELWWKQLEGATEHESHRLRHDLAFFARALLSPHSLRMRRRRNTRGSGVPPSDLVRHVDLEWYSKLFVASDLVCGEVTPAYAMLPERTVHRIMQNFPATRFIVILRDPVERAVSHLNHWLRNERGDEPDAAAPDFHALIDSVPWLLEKSRVSTIRDNWLSVVPGKRMLVIDFAALRDRPAETRARVARFLSLDPDLYAVEPGLNRKAAFAKLDPPADVIERLETALAPERALYLEITQALPA